MASRAARKADDAGPERTCIVTRAQKAPEEMIRFVLAPSGEVTPDLRRKLPGRGVWVTGNAKIVAEAVRKGLFAKGFKAPAKAAANLPEAIDAALERDLLQMLSLANKAGAVAQGAFQVEKALAGGPLPLIFHASDGAPDGLRKLRQNVRRMDLRPDETVFVEFLNSEQIGLALGRTSVVHAAVRTSAAASALLARARRLEIFRGVAADGGNAGALEMDLARNKSQADGQEPEIEKE